MVDHHALGGREAVVGLDAVEFKGVDRIDASCVKRTSRWEREPGLHDPIFLAPTYKDSLIERGNTA